MHPIAKRILIAAAAIAALIGLGAFGVNISIQSEAFQKRLLDALARTTGGKVSVRSIYYTPWSGVVAAGLEVQSSEGQSQIESIRARIAIVPLLAGRVVVRQIDIRSPRIVLSTPGLPLPLPPDGGASGSSDAPPADAVDSKPPKATESPWVLEIERVKIRNASLSLPGPAGLPPLTVEGLAVDAHRRSSGMADGGFTIAKARLAPGVVVTNLAGKFDWNGGQFLSKDISGDWSGGRINAECEWVADAPPRFRFQASASNVSLARMLEDSGYSPEGTSGTLNADFHLSGAALDRETWAGGSSLRLDEARILPVESIRQLGQMLGVAELQSLELESATADLSAESGRIAVERACIATKNLRFDATGTADWDGRLDLRSRFHVSETLRNDSRGILGSGFQQSEEEGFTHMPFHIGGTIARPQADLVEKLVGLRIGQDVGGFLKSLFQAPKKDKKKKSQPPASRP